jgi:hypothetical protein
MARGVRKLRLVHPTGENDAGVAELERLIAEIEPPEPEADAPAAARGARRTFASGGDRTLPPIADSGIGPLPTDRTPLLIAVLSFLVALAMGAACWIVLQDSPATHDVNRRFDEETAELPREPFGADEHRKALLRSVRPDLAQPDAATAPTSPGDEKASDVPDQVVPKTVTSLPPSDPPETSPPAPSAQSPAVQSPSPADAPASPKAAVGADTASRTGADVEPERDETKGRDDRPDKIEKSGTAPERPAPASREGRVERPSVRAIRQAGIRHNFRRARASADRGLASGPLGPLVLPDALRPTQPPG